MTNFHKSSRIVLALAVLSVEACAPRNSLVTDNGATSLSSVDANYSETAHRAIQYMLENARDSIVGDDSFDPTRPVIVASSVDLNNFNMTSNFGRLMGQSLKIGLQSQRKNKIIEVDLRQGYIPIVQGVNAGEFLLSRNLLTLAARFNAGAALVSTYSVALNKVYITVELINVDQNVIVAAHQFEVPIGPRTWALLKNKEFPTDAGEILRYSPPGAATSQSYSKPWPFADNG